MRAILTYMIIHEGSNVLSGQFCDLLYLVSKCVHTVGRNHVTWCTLNRNSALTRHWRWWRWWVMMMMKMMMMMIVMFVSYGGWYMSIQCWCCRPIGVTWTFSSSPMSSITTTFRCLSLPLPWVCIFYPLTWSVVEWVSEWVSSFMCGHFWPICLDKFDRVMWHWY